MYGTILIRMAKGETTKEIALHLGIESKTVEYHRAMMGKCLKLGSIFDMLRFAFKYQFVHL